MLLRNTAQFRDLIEYTADQGQIRRFTIAKEETVKTNGFFFEHNNSVYGLCASEGYLWLVIAGNLTRYSDNIVINIEESENKRSFFVREDGAAPLHVEYRPEKPHWNFFAMENEDVDGFLLMHNILVSAERKAIFLGANN